MARHGVSIRAAGSELIGTAFFIFAALGAALTGSGSTALAFGCTVTVVAYATAHLGGGQLNPAVSVALAATGAIGYLQALINSVAQCAGATVAAALLSVVLPRQFDEAKVGANMLADGVDDWRAFLGEAAMTALLVVVVLQTTATGRPVADHPHAPLAIGLAVFVGNAMLIPLDGASLNPARSIGPAIVSGQWANYWVFIIGPLTGATLATAIHVVMECAYDRRGSPVGNHEPLAVVTVA